MRYMLMRQITISCLLAIIVAACTATKQTAQVSYSIKSYPVSADSVASCVNGNDVLCYRAGHHGYNWCVIVRADKQYKVFHGNSNDKSSFQDSICLSPRLISWAFDTLPSESRRFTPVYRKEYISFYRQLELIDSKGDTIYRLNDAIGYDGQGKEAFNKKLDELLWNTFMWITIPPLRQYIDSPRK